VDTSVKETREFQTEVKELLEIVINSLYTDREIFLRELISNAADALEKVRYLELTGAAVQDKGQELEISLSTDDVANTLTITDTGVGMTGEELVENLGTIAHSGSRAFIRHLAQGNQQDLNLIGQFGVGFYSAFMVAEKVTLYTRSYLPEAQGMIWTSAGDGSYSLERADDLKRGTKIVLKLKKDAADFAKPDTVKRIIKQYSSFVPFTIKVNGEIVNTVQAIWVKNKSEVTDEEYNEFYKYVADAYDEPLLRLHFTADVPLNINALLYVPRQNLERFGFGRLEPGVGLYCKKVLIEERSENILPQWLRFLKGVVDSEELPLNISRETLQDSALVARLKQVVTGRFLKFLKETAENHPELYRDFWREFGIFLKEGVAADVTHQDELVKLLRFESSATEPGELTSLDRYLERLKEGQEKIYYLNGPSRQAVEAGPYLEVFKRKGLEVLYTFDPIDDYILNQLGEYQGKGLVSADQAELNLPGDEDGEREDAEEAKVVRSWLKDVLGDRVSEVRISQRLVESPAVILNSGISNSMERMLRSMNNELNALPKILEINPANPVIRGLFELRRRDEEFARVVAEQILDNALAAAGLLNDPQQMVARSYKIMERAVH